MPTSPATAFILGAGSTFSISTDGTTFTPINQLKTIQFSGAKLSTDDITNMSSPNAFTEIAPTNLDAGQATVSGVFDPHDAGQTMLAACFNGRTLVSCKAVLATMAGDTTGFTRTFSAYVTDNNIDLSFDKATTISATFKITGAITDTVPTVG